MSQEMMTMNPGVPITLPPFDFAAALQAPFGSDDLEWKVQTCGNGNNGIWALVVPYISARAIQARLDQVMGVAGWKNRYEPIMKGPDVAGWLCFLALKFDGEWIEKVDGADLTDIEAVKGGLSNALKRAAVQWGLGRYLYSFEKCWANVHANGKEYGKTKEGAAFRWDPPAVQAAAPAVKEAAKEPAGKAPAPPAATQAPGAPATQTTTSSAEPTERQLDDVYKEVSNLGRPSLAKALWTLHGQPSQRAARYTALSTVAKALDDIDRRVGPKHASEIVGAIFKSFKWNDEKPVAADAAKVCDAIVRAVTTGEVPRSEPVAAGKVDDEPPF